MPQERLSAYLVEIEPHRSGDRSSVASRARSASEDVRFLRSIYVPEDDRWFLLYEGASTAEVAAAAERADASVVSIAVARDVPSGGRCGHCGDAGHDDESAIARSPGAERKP